MEEALLAFVAIFITVDVAGILPLYLSLTAGLPAEVQARLPWQSTLTAVAIGVGFLLIGRPLFRVLGVSLGDFQVAGGTLLLVFSIHDLLHPGKPLRRPVPTLGAVPLGTPLIVGPAVLTTLVLLAQNYGYGMTLGAFAANMVLVFLALRHANRLERFLGEAGSHAIAKVASLLLAAFGVSLIRRGVGGFLDR
jgi:multiple antibiotic resistance protein